MPLRGGQVPVKLDQSNNLVVNIQKTYSVRVKVSLRSGTTVLSELVTSSSTERNAQVIQTGDLFHCVTVTPAPYYIGDVSKSGYVDNVLFSVEVANDTDNKLIALPGSIFYTCLEPLFEELDVHEGTATMVHGKRSTDDSHFLEYAVPISKYNLSDMQMYSLTFEFSFDYMQTVSG